MFELHLDDSQKGLADDKSGSISMSSQGQIDSNLLFHAPLKIL